MGLTVAGSLIENPMSLWRNYASRFYNTLRSYDGGPPGNARVLTSLEAWRSRVIGSRLTRTELSLLVERAIGAPWGSVPITANLATAPPESSLFTAATELYYHFLSPKMPGIWKAKVHKTLHIKRPQLFPILDSRISRVYKTSAAAVLPTITSAAPTLGVQAVDSPAFWMAIRNDIIDPVNIDALSSYRLMMAADQSASMQLMSQLPTVRLFDMIAWMIA